MGSRRAGRPSSRRWRRPRWSPAPTRPISSSGRRPPRRGPCAAMPARAPGSNRWPPGPGRPWCSAPSRSRIRAAPDEAWYNGMFVVTPDLGPADGLLCQAPSGAVRRIHAAALPVLGWLHKVVPVGDDDFTRGTRPPRCWCRCARSPASSPAATPVFFSESSLCAHDLRYRSFSSFPKVLEDGGDVHKVKCGKMVKMQNMRLKKVGCQRKISQQPPVLVGHNAAGVLHAARRFDAVRNGAHAADALCYLHGVERVPSYKDLLEPADTSPRTRADFTLPASTSILTDRWPSMRVMGSITILDIMLNS